MRQRIRSLKQQRAGLIDQMRAILNDPKGDNGTLDADQQAKHDDLDAEVSRLETQINQLERQLERDESLDDVEDSDRGGRSGHRADPGGGDDPDPEAQAAERREAYNRAFFDGFCRVGPARTGNRLGEDIRNALETGVDSEGGYLVPEEWAASLIQSLEDINVIRRYASSIRTASQRNIPVVTGEGDFTWIDEEGAYGEDDPAFGEVQLLAHKCGGIIKVSEELLQDNVFNLAGYLNTNAARRFGRIEENAFLNGDGVGKPLGLFQTVSVAGVNLVGQTGASQTTITFDELIDTFHQLKRQYRSRATWLTNDSMVKNIRKLKDTDGQYLWQPSVQAGEPDRVLSRPIETSDSAPAIAANTKTILFGDFSYYQIGDRLGITAQRLSEKYADTGQVGFRFNRRLDAKLTLAEAMTFFQQAV